MRIYIRRSEGCSACCRNADQETSQHESFSYSIHSAIHLCRHEFYAPLDLGTCHYQGEAYMDLTSETFLVSQMASNTTQAKHHVHKTLGKEKDLFTYKDKKAGYRERKK